MRIQIYEIQTPAEAEQLIEIGVDHIGSVLLRADRWRDPQVAETVRLVADSPACSSLIPLFSSADAISRALDYHRPDIVHLCEILPCDPAGAAQLETILEVQATIRRRFPEMAIMRSWPIQRSGEKSAGPDLSGLLPRLAAMSDWFLTDTLLCPEKEDLPGDQPVQGFVGITGLTCDWEQAAGLVEASEVPVILAGGIGPENVYEGLMQTRPAGVDSCTRTNAGDGRGGHVRFKKDLDKVRTLVREVRRAEADLADPVNTARD